MVLAVYWQHHRIDAGGIYSMYLFGFVIEDPMGTEILMINSTNCNKNRKVDSTIIYLQYFGWLKVTKHGSKFFHNSGQGLLALYIHWYKMYECKKLVSEGLGTCVICSQRTQTEVDLTTRTRPLSSWRVSRSAKRNNCMLYIHVR